jgi:Flp pilus assembly protein TadD
MESNNTHKYVAVAAGVAALGAVGYLLYKTSRKEEKNKSTNEKTAKESNPTTDDSQQDLAYKQGIHIQITPSQTDLTAIELKEFGNAAFKRGNFKEAVDSYTKAMEISKKDLHFLLSNRSAAFHASGDFIAAKADALSCISENLSWSKVNIPI